MDKPQTERRSVKLDDFSVLIGQMSEKLDSLDKSTQEQWEKLDEIRETVASLRVRTATTAALVSVGTVVIGFLTKKLIVG